MSHRAHLFSLRIASALRESVLSGQYSASLFRQDLIAGITVGLIAIPLSMALAIASGVAPEYGLYAAIFAGFIVALLGGSRLSVTGPTAAFVVILHPVAIKFGLAGLLVASVLAGVIMIGFAVARLGRLIEYIPESVTLGFTGGIAIVIATLQQKDLFGLPIGELPESYIEKWRVLFDAFPQGDWASALVAALTFAVLLLWPRLKISFPSLLPALLLGVTASLLLAQFGYPVDTIGSRFTHVMADGQIGHGIPSMLPSFDWPWNQPGPGGQPLEWSFGLWRELLPAAFSIAMLGAIESLLCAVVLDGMTGRRHHANGELLAQGIGNVVAPFFGGITSTAALARSVSNYKAGAISPIASMMHAVTVLLGLLLFAEWLSWLPMASLAAVLLMVAWNMSSAGKVVQLFRTAPLGDRLLLTTCLLLTVFFDMVIAISVGIVLASLLFMREVSLMTKVTDVTQGKRQGMSGPLDEVPEGWSVFKISGPLFFAAADRIFSELLELSKDRRGVILYMDGVPVLDAGGYAAFTKYLDACIRHDTRVIVADLQFQPLKTIARARLMPIADKLIFTSTLREGIETAQATGI